MKYKELTHEIWQWQLEHEALLDDTDEYPGMWVITSKGYSAFVDSDEYEQVMQVNWFHNSDGYSVCKSKSICVYLHRWLTNALFDVQIDHKNRNPWDNRKHNLRFATRTENSHNRSVQSNNTSGFKGVCWHKNTHKYCAQIRFNGKHFHLGLFETAIEAARAYNEKAIELHGEFASLNDLDDAA